MENNLRDHDRICELRNLTEKKYKYKISYKGNIHYINIDDIIYIETFNRKLRLIMKDNHYIFVGKITEEAQRLSHYGFLLCHQGYLVNIMYIKGYENNQLVLLNGQSIPVSKNLKNKVLSELENFLSEIII